MFPYYLLPGNKPKPKPKRPSSYLPSYLTVYVKPDPPPAQASIPDDILPFVNPNPAPVSQPERAEYNPLSSIQAPKRGSGNRGSSSSRDSRREKTVGNGAPESSGAREIIPDKSLPDIADVPGSGIDPADLKFYFAAREHDLVRSVEAALTHEGLPARYHTEPAKFVRENLAEYGMDAEADAVAEEYTRKYAEEMGLQRAQEVTREVIEDLANDEMESVVAVDRDTGEIIFVRYGDENSVTLQEEQRKLAEGRNIVLIHNHWNNTAASLADLGAADWLDAERVVVATPSGKRYYYHRRDGRLVALKPVQGPGVAAESDPEETAVARLLHMMQSAREAGNPAERVMEQGEQVVMIHKGEQIFLDAPQDVPLEVAQVVADRLYEVIMLESEEIMQIIDSQWEVLWQRDTSRQRSTAYGIWDLLLGTVEGVQSEIEFYDAADEAASLVAVVEDLGQARGFYLKQTLAETPYIFSHIFSFSKYQEGTYDDTLKLLDAIGEKLYDVNLDIFSSLLLDAQRGKNELISPYTNRAVASALEWDIHMVWTEQSAVQEVIDGENPPQDQRDLVTEFFNLDDGGYLFSFAARQEAIEWAEEELGIDIIKFDNLEYRIALGIAMVFKKHNLDREDYTEMFDELMKEPL